ncbi:MAG: 3',5'-cyclic-nucleotide phosphodiesterase [Sphingobium sp.]
MAAALMLAGPAPASPTGSNGFDVVALGVRGGVVDGNLSAFMIQPHGDERALTCDAGTLTNGIKIAAGRGAFRGEEADPEQILKKRIKGYLISHAHLDHVAGLLIAAPDDSAKSIYALPSVNGRIESSYFNWDAWANFTDRGRAPLLGKYHVVDLPVATATPVADTAMMVTAYPLAHDGVESTAFLIETGGGADGGAALLCLGDTGADVNEPGGKLSALWAAVADRVKARRLKALVIEVSYPDGRPKAQLFGHLTPELLLRSLADLEQAAGGKGSLAGLPVIVAHIKYPIGDMQRTRKLIAGQLKAGNSMGVRFILPDQGDRWHFR